MVIAGGCLEVSDTQLAVGYDGRESYGKSPSEWVEEKVL